MDSRQKIAFHTAQLFNERGIGGTSISAIMAATGFQKGGIYNHFESKEALTKAALTFYIDSITARILQRLEGTSTPLEKLEALIDATASVATTPIVPGGCLLITLASENGALSSDVRQMVSQAFSRWEKVIREIVAEGQAGGAFETAVEPQAAAHFITSTIEGSIIMSEMRHSSQPTTDAVNLLKDWIAHRLLLPT